mgnify:CR=1 FL=1
METASRPRFAIKKAPEIKAFGTLNVRRYAAVWQSPPSACAGWSGRIPGSISAGCCRGQRTFRTGRRAVYAAGKCRHRVPCRQAEPPAGSTCTAANRKSSAHTHAALAVVQRQTVAAIIVGAQPPDQPVAASPLGGRQALDLIQPSSPLSPSHS